MKSSLVWRIIPLAIYLLSFLPYAVFADTPCDSIIGPVDVWTRHDIVTIPVEDCGDPFKTIENFHAEVSSPYTLTVEGEVVSGNETVSIPLGGTDDYVVTGNPLLFDYYAFFYLHDGDDYRYVDTSVPSFEPTEDMLREYASGYAAFEGVDDVQQYIEAVADQNCSVFLDPNEEGLCYAFWADAENAYYAHPPRPFLEQGTYTMVVTEYNIYVTQNTLFERFWARIVPTAYAYDPGFEKNVFTLTFTLVEEEEESLDPLLLEYLPILRMHPDEDYLPMNVEAFVEASALWDDNGILPDQIVKPYSKNDPVTVQYLGSLDDTEDLYLAFSDPANAKSIDLAAAQEKYDDLVSDGEAEVTVYARRMQDSYQDSQGKTHEFTVLQYWYFYAMNNWGEKGGFNNHEGDWESVFVFLDENEDPKYVAFSAHRNDGEAEEFNFHQYDSVRRKWADVEADNNQVISYVALGSHANYPKSGIHSFRFLNDLTSEDGERLIADDFIQQVELETESTWLGYEGKWGADGMNLSGGDDGPQGPLFIDVSGHLRYHNPLEWAGIDVVDEITVAVAASSFSFTSGLKMNFSVPISEGTQFSVSPYKDIFVTGTLPQNMKLLPSVWDIESSLPNGTFSVQVLFPIDDGILDSHDASLQELGIYLYKTDTETWEEQQSSIDESGDFVILNTSHFSRYALGIKTVDPADPLDTASGTSQGSKARSVLLDAVGTSTALVLEERDKYSLIQQVLNTLMGYVVAVHDEGRMLTDKEGEVIRNFLTELARILEVSL